ncbi:MAG: hypothetical protein PHO41_00715 [Eubacteriales bacterium]|nr:hypothetical protein [Eubacteriales bacterium]
MEEWSRIINLILVSLAGALVSFLGPITIRRIRRWAKEEEPSEAVEKEIELSARISIASRSLHSSAKEIDEIQAELQKRIELVEKLKKDAEVAENVIQLSNDQVTAIRSVLNQELKQEGRKSFWKSAALNFFFFILGAAATYFIPMLFTKPV